MREREKLNKAKKNWKFIAARVKTFSMIVEEEKSSCHATTKEEKKKNFYYNNPGTALDGKKNCTWPIKSLYFEFLYHTTPVNIGSYKNCYGDTKILKYNK